MRRTIIVQFYRVALQGTSTNSFLNQFLLQCLLQTVSSGSCCRALFTKQNTALQLACGVEVLKCKMTQGIVIGFHRGLWLSYLVVKIHDSCYSFSPQSTQPKTMSKLIKEPNVCSVLHYSHQSD